MSEVEASVEPSPLTEPAPPPEPELFGPPWPDYAPGQLVSVTFKTLLGAEYVLPDMDASEMKKLALFFPAHFAQVTLVNVSQACLVLPMRVVKSFLIDGVERWIRPE